MYRRLFSGLATAALLALSALGCEKDLLRVEDRENGTAVSPYFKDADAGVGLPSPVAAGDAGAIACFEDSDCDDLDSCTGIETCFNGFCLGGGRPACFDGDPCTVDSCVQETATCNFETASDGTLCDDGNLCDGQTCVGGSCMAGPAPVCAADPNPCTIHSCDPATGGCSRTVLPDGASCSDGNACNGVELCSSGACLAGVALVCNDGNACTRDVCDAVAGCVSANLSDGAACADGDLCNGTETCHSGACQPGPAPTCDDHNPCTTEACNPVTGACLFSPLPNGSACPDGNLCDGQTCNSGVCGAGAPVVCATDNDNNPCTFNACQPATGTCAQSAAADGSSCADENVCNGVEACSAGRCVSPGPLVCPDDGNPCTTSVCSATIGCILLTLEDGSSCGNATLCDGAEICAAGRCTAGTPVSCTEFRVCNANTGLCEP